MTYKEVIFPTADADQQAILIALLSVEGYEAFEETDTALRAYIPLNDWNAEAADAISERTGIAYQTTDIARQNWNAQWEAGFEPVIVEGFCTVRAGFHTIEVDTPYEIIITPKMSFGTGHHATTQLMMMHMQQMGFAGKVVLDFGSGTGILSILAAQLGAGYVTGIDIDEWPVENAIENAALNGIENIQLLQGSLEVVADGKYDVILANINRHILLQYMQPMMGLLVADGYLLLSGILTEDEAIITAAATAAGFHFQEKKGQAGWLALLFKR